MSKDINLNNKYRVLLTEVLPYELPLLLDNEGFYINMQDEDLQNIFNDTFTKNQFTWTIPFDYSVRKYGGDKSRKLSLMHPLTQLQCADFYKSHDYYMLSLCSKSPFSIRYISECAKCIFKAEELETMDEQEQQNRVEVLDGEVEKRYRSYFSYKRYDMMYKFFTSGDYLRLEQKYTHLMKMDIASCFYHIYTHTITWAVKGKEQAKAQIGKSTFENHFDTLMRQANYNETNGIIVGPEISRIFAEIILQRIDVNVLNRLKQEPYSLKLGRDYEVRRYVDDYYIYANSKEKQRLILDVYREELQFYKLYVNESKLEFLERPFVSSVSVAKREINELISDISKHWLVKDESDKDKYKYVVKNEMSSFSSVVNCFRSITYRYNQKYGTLNRYFLTLLISQVCGESKKGSAAGATAKLLLMYLEIAFYVFSLDMSASASIKLCRILNELHKWAEKCIDKTILPELENRTYREVKRCLDIYEVNRKNDETNLEILNLMLCLSRIMKTPIPQTQLVRLFNITKGNEKEYKCQNYFQICTLLYIIGGDENYNNIRVRILEEIKRRVKEENSLRHADTAMLYFDALVCPFFAKSERKDIIMNASGCSENKAYEKLKIYNKTKRWFFNWDKERDLSELISKKEYHSPYE
jgi:hypothetical protein